MSEPGEDDHGAAGTRQRRPPGEMAGGLCDGAQRDHRTHIQVSAGCVLGAEAEGKVLPEVLFSCLTKKVLM